MQFTPFRLNLYLLKTIPIAWIAGIRVKEISSTHVMLKVRHRWLNQNPFRSIYFGVMVMAGELATGIPLFQILRQQKQNISMLVVEHQSFFYKKATGTLTFRFDDFDTVRQAVAEAARTGQPVRFRLRVTAVNNSGDITGEFYYTWSLKKRSSVQ